MGRFRYLVGDWQRHATQRLMVAQAFVISFCEKADYSLMEHKRKANFLRILRLRWKCRALSSVLPKILTGSPSNAQRRYRVNCFPADARHMLDPEPAQNVPRMS